MRDRYGRMATRQARLVLPLRDMRRLALAIVQEKRLEAYWVMRRSAGRAMFARRKAPATQATLALKRALWRMLCSFALHLASTVAGSPRDSEDGGVSVELSSSGLVSGSKVAATKPTASQATPPSHQSCTQWCCHYLSDEDGCRENKV